MSAELKKAVQRESLAPKFAYMPKEEWQSRIAKVRALMKKREVDALLILNGQDRLYFFGATKTYKNAYPAAGIIPAEGATTMVMEFADSLVLESEGYAEWNIGYRGDSQAPTATAPEPVQVIAEAAVELGLSAKTIGMEFGSFMWWDGLTMNEWEALKQKLPKTRFVDATELIWEMRMIKSVWEVDVMRYLHRLTAKGYFQIINNARKGANERKLLYDALQIWIDEGIVDSTNYTLSCLNAIQPFRDRILKEGDWMMLDGGPSYKGYCSDMQRFVYIGEPGREYVKAGNLACEGMWAVEEILRPGVTAGQIWSAAYGKMAEKDPEIWRKARSRRMVGWVGHGEGLNIHEPPYFVEGSNAVIREGMVVAVEVPSYYDRTFANFPEDTYVITSNGYEKLSKDLGPIGTYIKS